MRDRDRLATVNDAPVRLGAESAYFHRICSVIMRDFIGHSSIFGFTRLYPF
ncbi:MAG TPA: hypothetical protein VMF08_07160 [Candidatus Sulfotelmatobacter sp.]|nr:hypothetical protein [Candidatus Sulfotelmatobacter sp.]